VITSFLEKPADSPLMPIPETAVNVYTPKNPFPAEVVSKYRITDSSSPNYGWHVVLNLKGSKMVGKYRIGQSIGVVPTGRFNSADFNYAHDSLTNKIRLYSITSACWGDDWKGETVSLCVKREIAEDAETGELVLGVDSNYICDAKPGDEMLVTGPVGKSFILPDNPLDYNYVFTATGTGIAPFVGMLVELFNQGFEREVWLVFGVPYSTDIMYNEEFLYFAERHPNFHYTTAISREQTNPRGGKMYVQDRLEEHQDGLAPLLEQPDTLFYMCGLKGMEYGIYPWVYRIGSNLVSLPDDLTVADIEGLSRDAPEWSKIERARDRKRLFKETY
jgi:ferredoxin--NADP+ reductase